MYIVVYREVGPPSFSFAELDIEANEGSSRPPLQRRRWRQQPLYTS